MKEKKILLLIFILAGALRFNKLGKIPPSLNLDEVAIGYNAYSILKTSRDEYGEKFPLAFRSHDDYKPPLYIYLTVPSVAIFGLNEFAVRFPSALFGTLTVFMTFFLAKEFLQKDIGTKKSETVASLSALLLAVNPWHLQFSRAAFETNVAVFFTVLGTWAFLKGVRSKARWWYLTAISFALSLYTYQAVRLFIPLFTAALALIFAKSVRANLQKAIISASLFFVLIAPLIPIMTSTAGVMRFKGASVFEHPGLIEEEEKRMLEDATNQDRFAMKVFHNRKLAGLITVINGYLKHFRPDVFFTGMWGPLVNYTPNVGLFYLIELPLILWGTHIFANLTNKKLKALFFTWILLAPLASSFTIDIPSSTRMTVILPTLQILSALGLFSLISAIRKLKNKMQQVSFAVLTAIFFFSFTRYLHQYYVHAPVEFARDWYYGYKQAVQFVQNNQDEYERVIISTSLKQPQNFFAFYTKYDPWTYIFVDGGTVSGGFLETSNKFGKFEFHPIDYGKLDKSEKLLLVDLYSDMHQEYKKNALEVIRLPDSEPIIVISHT